MSNVDIRATQDEAVIAWVRQACPVEPEIDRILTRKLRGRSGPEYHPIPLECLVDAVARLITVNIGEAFAIANPRWLSGGASKVQMAFDLEWRGVNDAGALRSEPMVQVSRV